jgi:hypothetical protein
VVQKQNGPDPEQPLLWWHGTPHRLRPTDYRLLALLWCLDSIPIESDWLIAAWGDTKAPSGDALSSACGRVNKLLLSLKPAFTRGRRGLKIGLVCWKDR